MTKSILGGVLILAVGLPVAAGAHSGGLDANGCHHDSRTGMYECHQGVHAGQVFASKDDMEKGAIGRPGGKGTSPEPTRKAKEQAAETKADRTQAMADEKAQKKQIAAEQRVDEAKADTEKAKAEAKAEKKKAKAEAKAAKKRAKAEEKAAKEKAKADDKATR